MFDRKSSNLQKTLGFDKQRTQPSIN